LSIRYGSVAEMEQGGGTVAGLKLTSRANGNFACDRHPTKSSSLCRRHCYFGYVAPPHGFPLSVLLVMLVHIMTLFWRGVPSRSHGNSLEP
jgi:hypothetical protein